MNRGPIRGYFLTTLLMSEVSSIFHQTYYISINSVIQLINVPRNSKKRKEQLDSTIRDNQKQLTHTQLEIAEVSYFSGSEKHVLGLIIGDSHINTKNPRISSVVLENQKIKGKTIL